MTAELLSMILDFVILIALVGTIYYAFNLTRSLNDFKKQREEMKAMIGELVKNIDEAQTAIDGLKAASHVAADNLDDVLHESKKMAEELKIINDTSNSLANRLERSAASGRVMASPIPSTPYDENDFDDDDYEDSNDEANDVIEPPSFFIQDRDFDSEDDEDDADLSRAERELIEALQGQKQGRGGR